MYRSRKPIKNYDANMGNLDQGITKNLEVAEEKQRSHRQYRTLTIEMEDEKNTKVNPNTQNSFTSRYDQSTNN